MGATLASALTLIWLGKVLDSGDIHRLAGTWIALLAIAALIMGTATTVPQLVLALFLLRLFGQGMLTHTAMVAMGRWFHAERGRAISVTSCGYQLGEGLLPLAVVALLAMSDWRWVWGGAFGLLLVVALPLSQWLLGTPRQPSFSERENLETGRQWTRAEVLRDLPFWAVCTGVLAPSFIGTSVFFHQVHLGTIKGWSGTLIASTFAVMSVSSLLTNFVSGFLVDRWSAKNLLPFFLLPLGLGCTVLAYAQSPWTMVLFMYLLGTSTGMAGAVFGAIWPEVYGVRHLGSIRALVSAAMVFASAVGPGLTGWLIDRSVGLEFQLLLMSAYCLLTMLALIRVSDVLCKRCVTLQVRV